jgi:arsenate reductase
MASKNISTKVTIWHNPKCGTSRKVLEMIRAKGIAPTIVDYVKSPPSAADIKTVLKEMGSKPRDIPPARHALRRARPRR